MEKSASTNMLLKRDNMFLYVGASLSDGKWIHSHVSLYQDGSLKIKLNDFESNIESFKTYSLSSEWFTIIPRNNSFSTNLPPLMHRKQPNDLFALTKPPDITIWFFSSSKNERDKWVELILPLITFKPSTPLEPPPPYSEYDNLSYYPWDLSSAKNKSEEKQLESHNFSYAISSSHRSGSYTVQEPSKSTKSFSPHNRSGFYSVEKHSKKFPPPAPSTPIIDVPEAIDPHNDVRIEKGCCHWCSVGCAFCCNILFLCLHQCCNNFCSAF